jgi:hypothetical protein
MTFLERKAFTNPAPGTADWSKFVFARLRRPVWEFEDGLLVNVLAKLFTRLVKFSTENTLWTKDRSGDQETDCIAEDVRDRRIQVCMRTIKYLDLEI